MKGQGQSKRRYGDKHWTHESVHALMSFRAEHEEPVDVIRGAVSELIEGGRMPEPSFHWTWLSLVGLRPPRSMRLGCGTWRLGRRSYDVP